jgi:hypothetical protein
MSSPPQVTSTFVLWLLLARVSSPDPSAATRTPAPVPGVASALQAIVNSAAGLPSVKLTPADHRQLVALYGVGEDGLCGWMRRVGLSERRTTR